MRYVRAEVIAAVRECSDDLGRIPTFYDYVAWQRRPEVMGRPGRRPASQGSMVRLFGSWFGTLEAAGVSSESDDGVVGSDGHLRRASYSITDALMIDGMNEVARRIGRSPNTTDYVRQREAIFETEGRALPSYGSIYRRFLRWDDALAFAGLSSTPAGRGYLLDGVAPRWRTSVWTAELALPVVRDAYLFLGEPFTAASFRLWRKSEIDRDRTRRRELPSLSTVISVFGSWCDVRRAGQVAVAAFGMS